MNDTSPEGESPRFGQGAHYEGQDPEILAQALETAFDYRGNVTLRLGGGEEVKGFVANRDRAAPEPYVEIFPADGSEKRRILYGSIEGVAFTGRDTAAGKSWETWVKKYREKKEAEARGEKRESIGLYPEEID